MSIPSGAKESRPPHHHKQQHEYQNDAGVKQIELVVAPQFGPRPQPAICPYCKSKIVTRISYNSSGLTHLFALLTFCLFCPLFWLPYCIRPCKNANHFCPSCKAFLGTYRR